MPITNAPELPVTFTTDTGFLAEPFRCVTAIVWDSLKELADVFADGPFRGTIFKWTAETGWVETGRYLWEPDAENGQKGRPNDVYCNEFYGDTDPAEQQVSASDLMLEHFHIIEDWKLSGVTYDKSYCLLESLPPLTTAEELLQRLKNVANALERVTVDDTSPRGESARELALLIDLETQALL